MTIQEILKAYKPALVAKLIAQDIIKDHRIAGTFLYGVGHVPEERRRSFYNAKSVIKAAAQSLKVKIDDYDSNSSTIDKKLLDRDLYEKVIKEIKRRKPSSVFYDSDNDIYCIAQRDSCFWIITQIEYFNDSIHTLISYTDVDCDECEDNNNWSNEEVDEWVNDGWN